MAQDRSALAQQIKQIIAEQLQKPVAELADTASLDQLGADSLDRIEIIMKLEETFTITIDDEAAEKRLHTIGDVVDYIAELTAA